MIPTTGVDFWGRLSNPPEILEKLADQGSSGPARHPGGVVRTPEWPDSGTAAESSEQKGRLSNPVRHRLSDAEILDLIRRYGEGASIDGLARGYGVHRTTVIGHLDRAGVPRRRLARKMTDAAVDEAAVLYAGGDSLATVAERFGVDPRTVARELRRMGEAIRPRRG